MRISFLFQFLSGEVDILFLDNFPIVFDASFRVDCFLIAPYLKVLIRIFNSDLDENSDAHALLTIEINRELLEHLKSHLYSNIVKYGQTHDDLDFEMNSIT